MYIDMGERIAEEQDRPSLHFGSCNEKLVFQIISPYCTYVSIVMRAAFADISVPLTPLDFM